jgi:hypothetical protein
VYLKIVNRKGERMKFIISKVIVFCLVFGSFYSIANAHSVSTTSGSGWEYEGSHSPLSTAYYTYDSSANKTWDNVDYRTINRGGIQIWTDAQTYVKAAVDYESGNKIYVYSSWWSNYYAYHKALEKDNEHQKKWELRYNHRKMKSFSTDFKKTVAAHEWGHVFGLKDVSYSHVLMYNKIGEGGGSADGPSTADINGIKAIWD